MPRPGLPEGPNERSPLAHIIDAFTLESRHVRATEWIVGVDFTGTLLASPADALGSLDSAARTELAYGEVSCRPRRTIYAEELYLFDLELVEQSSDAPGTNDPVHLYGALQGPYPAAPDHTASRIEGQLTVTRADVFAGLASGAGHAWRYGSSSETAVGRCLNLLLPADRTEEIAAGRGLVLAYPLLPPDLWMPAPANEILVSQILFDLLAALRKDLGGEDAMKLPVPNRSAFIAELEGQGYTVEGGVATRRAAGTGLRRVLASVAATFAGDKVTIPPEGKIDQFLAIAASALTKLDAWPTPAQRAIASLTQRVVASPRRGGPPHWERPDAPPASAAAPRPPHASHASHVAPRPAVPEWTKDFMVSHESTGGSYLTTTRPGLVAVRGAWAEDFSAPRPKEPAPATTSDRAADWMKDFEPKS